MIDRRAILLAAVAMAPICVADAFAQLDGDRRDAEVDPDRRAEPRLVTTSDRLFVHFLPEASPANYFPDGVPAGRLLLTDRATGEMTATVRSGTFAHPERQLAVVETVIVGAAIDARAGDDARLYVLTRETTLWPMPMGAPDPRVATGVFGLAPADLASSWTIATDTIVSAFDLSSGEALGSATLDERGRVRLYRVPIVDSDDGPVELSAGHTAILRELLE